MVAPAAIEAGTDQAEKRDHLAVVAAAVADALDVVADHSSQPIVQVFHDLLASVVSLAQ